MAKYTLKLPRMGESVLEATIVRWLKQPGDRVEEDDSVLEIATDKVDSDVPSPVSGTLLEQLVAENAVAQVGEAIAIIETDGEPGPDEGETASVPVTAEPTASETPATTEVEEIPGLTQLAEREAAVTEKQQGVRFYSPLVRNIAAEEGIPADELDRIPGTGTDGRVTKQDILKYLENRKVAPAAAPQPAEQLPTETSKPVTSVSSPAIRISAQDEIIEMDRMRRLIAEHMVRSVQTSPHVCSFVEADVTNLVLWRNRVKDIFEKREGEKITFTPIFIEAVAKAIRDFPMINISVSGTQIIKRRNINIGMATALPSGNLIVPVIKNADQLSLVGLAKTVNDLATRARANQLKPDDTQDGTFTLTNIGAFGNIMGTPIINQPQVAILAVGTITKRPAVIETEYGDMIGIRHMMYLSMSYDHRVVDGALGGMFLRRVGDYLENWDVNREL